MRTRRKVAILAVPLLLLGAAVLYCGRVMKPFAEGSSGDFWHAACHVQVDPAKTHKSRYPTYPPREGYFAYMADGGMMWIHGIPEYYVAEATALADFPAVVRALAAGEHLDEERPLQSKIVNEGYRAWLIANPERDDAFALLASIRAAWLDHWQQLDRSRPGFDYSAYRSHIEAETDFDERWERAKLWPANVVGEFAYLSFLIVFAAWPWLRNSRPWRWGFPLGLLPVLLFLPYWFGYARLTFTSADRSGGALYPELIRPFRGLPWTGFDTWALRKVPRFLSDYSQSPGPMLAISGMGGVGLAVAFGFGAALGLTVYAFGTFHSQLRASPRLFAQRLREDVRKVRGSATKQGRETSE